MGPMTAPAPRPTSALSSLRRCKDQGSWLIIRTAPFRVCDCKQADRTRELPPKTASPRRGLSAESD